MNNKMNNADKILYYGVWGALIGTGIFYSFPYMRSITTPIIQYLTQILFAPHNSDGFLLFLVNIFWAVISALPPALASVIAIKFTLKARSILYYTPPIFVLLALSYWDIVDIINFYSRYEELPPYIPELLNPLVIIGVFLGVYWLFEKHLAPNTRTSQRHKAALLSYNVMSHKESDE